jgi:replicative DNA helicase Mcm
MAKIMDVLRRFRKLSESEKELILLLGKYLTVKRVNVITGFVKERKISIEKKSGKTEYSVLIANDDSVVELVTDSNSKIMEQVKTVKSKELSMNIREEITKIIAPHIVGFDYIKKAVGLQLFSPEHIHILLLGDPGTGKTQILSSVVGLSPKATMGLGSGTSGVGLAVTVKGNEVIKGLLPMADEGICAIDELNLMKEESRASLYNAMEKGFVSYDKGGHSYKFDARVSVLATANPKGDKFTGKNVEELKKQLPFDSALLTRFHLTFLVRKHTIDEFRSISKSILADEHNELPKHEKELITEYIRKAHEIKVKIPKKYENEIVEFVAKIKENEENYLAEISPRIVIGFSRLAKASARMEHRTEVNQKDVDLVKEIVTQSLKF